ncbi:MAG TPA: DoxX family protein [Flavipsychrobacter sp.]|nr:DoxX family protein [Flavipsychrobacter sp.]
MIKNIISLVLLIVSAALSFKHGWDTFNYKNNPQSLKMMSELGISEKVIPLMGALTILTGILLLFPRTFFWGNVLNAMSIVLIMALALRAGHVNMVLIEIPFLILPLVMIWLKYPFKN